MQCDVILMIFAYLDREGRELQVFYQLKRLYSHLNYLCNAIKKKLSEISCHKHFQYNKLFWFAHFYTWICFITL
jgi:hypothetical protein